MIVYHSKKTVFWRNPKTGSTSMEAALRVLVPLTSIDVATPLPVINLPGINFRNDLDPREGHLVPFSENDPLTDEQREEYDHYCFIRNPIERFISAYRHVNLSKIINGIDVEDMHRFAEFLDLLEEREPIFRHQHKYFDALKMHPLLFSHWDAEMDTMVRRLDGLKVAEYPTLRKNNLPTIAVHELPDKTIDLISDFYKRDVELYEEHIRSLYSSS